MNRFIAPHFAHTLCRTLLTCLVLLPLSACKPAADSSAHTQPAPANSKHYFPIQFEGTTIHIQLALNDSERAKGLMYRDSMATNHGMLFIFEQPGPQAFWMKNTRIPLDLAYLASDGSVLELHQLYPYDERSVPSRSQSVHMVLEMNRGWFERNQLTTGAQLDLAAIRTAIQARGFSPAAFAL